MKSEKEIHAAFVELVKERSNLEVEMTNQDKYRENLLQYHNLQAKREAICSEIRILQWVLSE